MPFYSYHCKRCDAMQDGYRHVSARHDSPDCCGEKTQLVIVPPAVQPDIPGYESPVTGKWVDGRSARREDLRRTGCRPYEPGEREYAQRAMADEERKSDRRLEEVVARSFYSMPEAKRRQLTRG